MWIYNARACGDIYQWKSEQRGRPRKENPRSARTVPWQRGIHCQRFFKQGHKSQYFEIQHVPTGPTPTPLLRVCSRNKCDSISFLTTIRSIYLSVSFLPTNEKPCNLHSKRNQKISPNNMEIALSLSVVSVWFMSS